ncbi:hypothetical protein D3C87_1141510 [compost metagenome]
MQDVECPLPLALPVLAALDLAAGEDRRAGAFFLPVPGLAVIDPGGAVLAIAAQGIAGARIAHAVADVLCTGLDVGPGAQRTLVAALLAVQLCREDGIRCDFLAIAEQQRARAFANGRLQPLQVALGACAGLLHVQHEAAADMRGAEIGLGDCGLVLELGAVGDLGIDLSPSVRRNSQYTGREDEHRQEVGGDLDRVQGAMPTSAVGGGVRFLRGGLYRHGVIPSM